MYDVICIGSATRDDFLKGEFPLIESEESPSGKVIALPFGEKVGVKDAYFTIGGNAVNASVTFARQGFGAACAAKIGDDLSGKELILQLKHEGVDISLVAQTKEKHTAYSVLLLENGERTILGYHGASDTFTLADLDLEKLKAKWWYLSLAGESDAMFPELINFAHKMGIRVAFNPSGYHIKHKPKEILAALDRVSVLVLNEGEAAELIGVPFMEKERVFRQLDKIIPGIVVVTDGSRGVTVSDGKNLYKAGIFKERELADRTGAGDAFGSGFVAALAAKSKIKNQKSNSQIENQKEIYSSEEIKFAIRLASANATSVVEQIGATEGILTKEQFEKDERWRDLVIDVASS